MYKRQVQLRFSTTVTSEDYVNGQYWQKASLESCPCHPQGGCHFARHGTYERVHPAGTKVARWYCPEAQQSFSLLPDCLASRLSSTLPEVEAVVRDYEQAGSRSAAADQLRLDIELPGALCWLDRRIQPVIASLKACKGLFPDDFIHCQPTVMEMGHVLGVASVLMALRQLGADFLQQLPAPLGFAPRRLHPTMTRSGHQHQTGADPPRPMI